MTKSGSNNPTKSSRGHANGPNISPWQRDIERHALNLRAQLGLSACAPLEHCQALKLIPNCEVWALKNVPKLPFEFVNHFRIAGYQLGAFAFKDADGDHRIVFNDSHHPASVRVHLMEEFFHIWLGHSPDLVRLYPSDGRHRTYSEAKEDQAYGCGVAALVPIDGLKQMLGGRSDVRRIAEHFVVPVGTVELRIAMTRLGHLVTPHSRPNSRLAPITGLLGTDP